MKSLFYRINDHQFACLNFKNGCIVLHFFFFPHSSFPVNYCSIFFAYQSIIDNTWTKSTFNKLFWFYQTFFFVFDNVNDEISCLIRKCMFLSWQKIGNLAMDFSSCFGFLHYAKKEWNNLNIIWLIDTIWFKQIFKRFTKQWLYYKSNIKSRHKLNEKSHISRYHNMKIQ